jgi:hypothetical protein
LIFEETFAFHKCSKDLSGPELDKWVYIYLPVEINTTACKDGNYSLLAII